MTHSAVLSLHPDEPFSKVYSFDTSKGYVEKPPTLTLEKIAYLSKNDHEKEGKEVQISEVPSTFSKKLRGRIITGEIVPNDSKHSSKKEPQLQFENEKKAESKKSKEEITLSKIGNEAVEKLASISEAVDNRSLLANSKNFFKVGNCYQCKKKRFVFQSFAYYMPLNCQKVFCAECLKEFYGEDIHEIIKTRTHWSTPFKRKICKTPAAILTTDSGSTRLDNSTEEEERVHVVDTYLKTQTKKMLDFNGNLIRKLEKNKKHLSIEEKMLSLKILHDNLENLLSLKQVAQENITKNEQKDNEDQFAYTNLINSVSNYMRKKKIDDRKHQHDESAAILSDSCLFLESARDKDEEEIAIRKRGMSENQFEILEDLHNDHNGMQNKNKRSPFRLSSEYM